MKRWVITIALVAALALVAAPLAAAHGNQGHHTAKGHAKFQCEATVVSVGTSGMSSTLVATVLHGSKAIKAEIKAVGSSQITFVLAPNAKLIGRVGGQPLSLGTLGSLVLGDKVHIGGTVTVDTSNLTAPVYTTLATKVILQKAQKTP